MNLFDILSCDERVLVLSEFGSSIIYTWNHSLTLQCWKREGSVYFLPDISRHFDKWEEIDVRTLSEPPFNYEHARAAAISWQGSRWKEEDENSSKPHRSRRKKKAR